MSDIPVSIGPFPLYDRAHITAATNRSLMGVIGRADGYSGEVSRAYSRAVCALLSDKLADLLLGSSKGSLNDIAIITLSVQTKKGRINGLRDIHFKVFKKAREASIPDIKGELKLA